MDSGTGPWQEGRRAWERLNGWHQDNPSATPGHPANGTRAVEALADIGLVRRQLDQAELAVVRTARRHGKSWAEIATKLGVTRQSAWARWRDLDDAESPPSSERNLERETMLDVETATTPAAVVEQSARDLRRRSSVVVPNVIGMSWDGARQVLHQQGLVGVGTDPDGVPLSARGWPGGVVTDQSPESGAKVPAGSPVRSWVDRGGGSAGVREPRRPKPSPKTAREMRYQPSDEAVG